MSEGITGASESSGTPAPAAPTSVDAALDQSFAASLTAETAPDAPQTPAVENGEPPTTEAAPQEEVAPVAPTEGKQGPIPFEVHHKALENARTKTEQEVTARLTQEWQTQVAPVMSAAKAIANDVTTGSIEGLKQLISEYEQHPVLSQHMRSLYGRMLAQRGQAPVTPDAPVNEPEPQADYEYNGVPFYSAPQMQKLQAWRERQLEAKVQQQLQPVQQHVKQQQEQQALAKMRADSETRAHAKYAQLARNPEFVAHQHLVAQRMDADKSLSVDAAWLEVYDQVVVPKKVQQGRHEFVTAAAKKSAGSTVDPAASAPAQPRRPRTIEEALDQSFSGL